MALLLAQARNVPQAHAALKAGRWERSRWEGVELADKTLGIVGLGRIGKLVAQRALRLRHEAHRLRPLRRRRPRPAAVGRPGRPRRADAAVRLRHASTSPKTKETVGLIGADLLAKAKPGIRIVNVARGGIVDEAALAEAIRGGQGRRRRPRRVRRGADDRRRRCSSSTRSSSRRTSAPPPARRRTRPATRSPTWCSSPSPATSCRSPSTSRPPRRRRRCGPFLPLAERLGRLYAALAGARRRQARGRVPGPAGRLRHPHPHAVGAQGRVRRHERPAGVVRQRAADRRGARRRGVDDVDVDAPRSTSTSSPCGAATTPSPAPSPARRASRGSR